jgi:NAD(P)-dependent dehydrogenase (short-subunit alcohol dehydrogenase family)
MVANVASTLAELSSTDFRSYNMTKVLTGKVALVTGGGRGIGAASAKALAVSGADVAISYVARLDKATEVVSELEKLGVRAKTFQADQVNYAQVEKLVADVVAHFGRLDILVNNAGVFEVGQIDATKDVNTSRSSLPNGRKAGEKFG